MAELPTGTVTFLFTDIEGSTRRWEQHPEAMRAALARHDALLREAIVGYSGAIFKTVGDAFCAAFDTAPEAVLAALAAQRALRDEPWSDEIGEIRVRMALQTGAAELRDDDYFGQPLNRVARLLSAGHGGQVLLALPTAELVRDTLPADATLLDLGVQRL
jgi:class 3 adenylate cyclase